MFRNMVLAFSGTVLAVVADANANMPLISVGLAPGTNPLPGLSSLASRLETQRHSATSEQMRILQRAYDDALRSTAEAVDGIFAGHSSYLQASDSAVRIKVMSSPGLATENLNKIRAVEAVREEVDAARVQQAAQEFKGLSQLIVQELQRGRVSFLSDPSLNLKVHASKIAFPTVLDILEGLESHRDSADSVLEQKILSMQENFCKAVNSMIASKLHR